MDYEKRKQKIAEAVKKYNLPNSKLIKISYKNKKRIYMDYRKTLAALINLIFEWAIAEQQIGDNEKNYTKSDINEIENNIKTNAIRIKNILVNEPTKCDGNKGCTGKS